METPYAIEMLNITKKFPGIIANDNITLQLRKGEIHALLGENGAGKSTLMSVLFGLYQPEEGIIKKDGKVVSIKNPNDANALGIGMVHQHFKLVECFSVLDNIILGVEPVKNGFLQKKEAREKVVALSEKYGLQVDPDAIIEDITVGMQQRTEILKMLYRDNEILIFDEPTAVLTPQEIDELMQILRNLAAEGKSDCGCCDFDDDYFEVECPSCGETICIDESILDEGSIECPACHENLEFEFDDCDCEEDD